MLHAVGEVLNNRYRIQKLLGQGGFGAVYRAWDMQLKLPCAVKQNRETLHNSVQQFTREASILSKLRHPNLPKVSDHFTLHGQGQYLVMEYIEGEDLGVKLEKAGGPLPEARVLAWADRILDALDYLHHQDPAIIHRDVKPANIRITPQGVPVLVDFGLAKIFSTTEKTAGEIQAVTSGYSPIEQYSSGITDARTDIYALGATLYTLLTGHVIHESVLRYLGDPVKPPNQLNPALSDAVSLAIERAIQIDPRQRWQTAAEFKAALHDQALAEARLKEALNDSPLEPYLIVSTDDQISPSAIVLPGTDIQATNTGDARSFTLLATVALLVFCLIGVLSGLYLLDPFGWLSGYLFEHDALTAAILSTQTDAVIPVIGGATTLGALDTLPAGLGEDGAKFRIGLLAPLSGEVPNFGLSAKEGADLAVKEWNARGGILGKQIEVVIHDSRCEAESSVEAANHLIFQERVRYIIGEVCSRASIPVSEIANQNRVVMISPVSTTTAVTVDKAGKTKSFVFRIPYIDAFQGQVMANFAINQGYHKAFILYPSNSEQSASLVQSFEEVFTSTGGQIVGKETYHASTSDFSPLLDKAKSSQADVLFLPDSYPVVNRVGRQVKAMGVPVVLMGGNGWDSPELDLSAVEGGYFTSHFSLVDERPILANWVRKYRTGYNGKMPDAVTVLTYDATNLLLAAIERAGEDDPVLVAQELAGMNWEGVSGTFRFDEQHNPIKSAIILSIQDGKRVYVTTIEP
jgi:branched-chain amino acid transport system substrate-binding protein